MTRGRKKDITIPQSRALTQQRDYRARKAQYVADLERRCFRAEAENARLRKELELTRAGLPPSAMMNSQVVRPVRLTQLCIDLPAKRSQASQLMHNLSAASVSLAEFQRQFELYQTQSYQPIPPSQSLATIEQVSHLSESAILPASNVSEFQNSPDFRRSPSLGDNCCGGIMDCRGLVEEDEEEPESGRSESPDHISFTMRTSGIRSTGSPGLAEHVERTTG